MNCGTIFYDTNFQFSDGTTLDKLAIVVANFGINYLVLKTTGQQHKKNLAQGCQLNDKPPNYFLPKGICSFPKDTWVLLDEVIEVDSITLETKLDDGIAMIKDAIPSDLMKSILLCALSSQDIELYYLEFLERAYDNL